MHCFSRYELRLWIWVPTDWIIMIVNNHVQILSFWYTSQLTFKICRKHIKMMSTTYSIRYYGLIIRIDRMRLLFPRFFDQTEVNFIQIKSLYNFYADPNLSILRILRDRFVGYNLVFVIYRTFHHSITIYNKLVFIFTFFSCKIKFYRFQ